MPNEMLASSCLVFEVLALWFCSLVGWERWLLPPFWNSPPLSSNILQRPPRVCILIFSATGTHVHGHIQVFTGRTGKGRYSGFCFDFLQFMRIQYIIYVIHNIQYTTHNPPQQRISEAQHQTWTTKHGQQTWKQEAWCAMGRVPYKESVTAVGAGCTPPSLTAGGS